MLRLHCIPLPTGMQGVVKLVMNRGALLVDLCHGNQ